MANVFRQAVLMAGATLALVLGTAVAFSQPAPPLLTLKVLVLENSQPMSYRDSDGTLTGFNVEFAQLLCAILEARCDVQETLLSKVIDQIARGEADFSTVSLTITPERAQRVLFTDPYRRDRTLWISKLLLTQSRQARVAAVESSLQHRWTERNQAEQAWSIVPLKRNADLGEALTNGSVDAIVAPFDSSMHMVKTKGLIQLGFSTRVIEADELSGAIGVAVNPARKALRDQLNAAIREIKSNGQLDRLNSRYFPFRVF
jgi:ABC-type amino acid transport substrate-binding protein